MRVTSGANGGFPADDAAVALRVLAAPTGYAIVGLDISGCVDLWSDGARGVYPIGFALSRCENLPYG